MIRIRGRLGFPSALLLALLLTGAQSGALAHVYGHDPGTLQKQSCTVCATASQLDSGCVDTGTDKQAGQRSSPPFIVHIATFETIRAPLARQRGPPVSL